MEMVTRKCLLCKELFAMYESHCTRGRGKFCGKKCYGLFRTKWKIGRKRMGETKPCLLCGKKFYCANWEKDRKYCSQSCGARGRISPLKGKRRPDLSGNRHPNWKGNLPTNCRGCGVPVNRYSKNHVCSHCFSKLYLSGDKAPWWVGGKLTPCVGCGEKHDRSKRQCWKCYTRTHRGENVYNWKGGADTEETRIRESPEYAQWRKDIFKRDNFTCKTCGVRGKTIHADHIRPFSLFPELRLVLSNGRVLCKDCHDKVTCKFLGWMWKNQFEPGVLRKLLPTEILRNNFEREFLYV